MSPPRSRRPRRGFTLIEVLLATVILGIGSGVLLLATARCLALVAKSRRYSAAQRLIQQVGAEHPVTRAAVQTGTQSGGFDGEEGFRWEREIAPVPDESRQGLYLVRTRVSWAERGRESFEEEQTWHYVPPEEPK